MHPLWDFALTFPPDTPTLEIVKRIVLCDNHCYIITDEDFDVLERISPGYARLAKDSAGTTATHFVCERCGQMPPLKLKPLHKCQSSDT